MVDHGKRPHCGNCVYSAVQKTAQEIGRERMVCRRFPPQVSGIMTSDGATINLTQFPVVTDQMVCGEHPAVSDQLRPMVELTSEGEGA